MLASAHSKLSANGGQENMISLHGEQVRSLVRTCIFGGPEDKDQGHWLRKHFTAPVVYRRVMSKNSTRTTLFENCFEALQQLPAACVCALSLRTPLLHWDAVDDFATYLQAALRRAVGELIFFAGVNDLHRCEKIVHAWGLKLDDEKCADYDRRTPLCDATLHVVCTVLQRCRQLCLHWSVDFTLAWFLCVVC